MPPLAAPAHHPRLTALARLSRAMAALCTATAVLLAAGMLVYWIMTPAPALFAQAGLAADAGAELGPAARALGFAVSMIPLGALIYGLVSARRCFRAFAAGTVFSATPIRRLRTFALAVIAAALLKPAAGAALSLLLSAQRGNGPWSLALHVGSDTLLALVLAGTVAVMASIMAEAAAIADENRQFV
ncbi:hypothetical protein GCM10007301_00950 [Azorhizobium oxalatiphilum]|uniref:DUF2975 domain-containing protein n=1 Tax=Azorhizobium oxalatiphilum TaxID=980631 RepID=A0A917BLB8_9HYPH|nr:DUF2975 domain-containing protein [Azorhizobium oxalatiphilum]GGF45237.1 hypothetical protein GCM10007301_00950 [Azorhizobium oxalatiphilum]